MNIKQIVSSGMQVTLSVSAADLHEFAREVYMQGRIDAAAAEKARIEAEAEQAKMEDDKLLTSAEVCDMLNVTRCTLYDWGKRDYLRPTAYVGKRPRYSLAAVERFQRYGGRLSRDK